MQIKCTSCGATNTISDSYFTINCSFCGTLIETKSLEVKNLDKNIIKCDIKDGEIKYINRGIESITELFSLYSDVEIDEVSEIYLKDNIIKSIKGISRFRLSCLDLTGNNLSVIDEIPNLERGTSHLFFWVRNNSELTDFSVDVIRKFNSLDDMSSLYLYFDGCPKFNFDSLGKIKFKDILTKKVLYYPDAKVEIEPLQNIEIPSSLKEQGFVKCISESDYEGYRIKNIEERNRIVWRLEIVNKPIETKEQNFDNKSLKKATNSSCFIATAAMGNYNHPVVVDLRSFRDNWLLKKKWGANFTIWYYQNGPKAARVIEQSTILRLLTFILIVKPLHIITKKL